MRLRDHKYKARPTVVEGKWFASKKEAKRYGELRLLEKAGIISNLKTQVRFPLNLDGEKICVYVADFTYRENGMDVVEDCKGMRLPIYLIKKRLMWAIYRILIRET